MRDRISEHVEQLQALSVKPMEVLEDHEQRLIEGRAQQNSLDSLQRSLLSDFAVHRRQRIGLSRDAEQTEEIGQSILEAAVEYCDLACHLLAALALIVFGGDAEITAQ